MFGLLTVLFVTQNLSSDLLLLCDLQTIITHDRDFMNLSQTQSQMVGVCLLSHPTNMLIIGTRYCSQIIILYWFIKFGLLLEIQI